MAVHTKHPVSAPPAAPAREKTGHLLLRAWCIFVLTLAIGGVSWSNAFGVPIASVITVLAALVSVALVNSWVGIPFNALVYRAAMIGIPAELFEAARVDGASRWQEIRHIIIPSVRPTTMILTVLTVVYGFRSFDFIYVMTFGGPGTATTTLPFLGYLQAFVRFDFGLGASTALIAVLMVFVLAVLYARGVRKEEK